MNGRMTSRTVSFQSDDEMSMLNKESGLVVHYKRMQPAQKSSQSNSKDLEKYVGTYARYAGASAQNVVNVSFEKGTLFFQPTGRNKFSSFIL